MKKFINELGNTIVIDIRGDTSEGYAGVYISIEGPASISTNRLTRKEAEELCDHLRSFLDR